MWNLEKKPAMNRKVCFRKNKSVREALLNEEGHTDSILGH